MSMIRFAATALAAFSFSGAAVMAQEVTLRLHQFLPPQANVPAKIIDPWISEVEEASGGRIDVQHFGAMSLGGTPPQLMDQVVDGVVDIVWTLPGYTPGRFPRVEVMELPFMMENGDSEAASRAYWILGERHMFDQDFKDVKVLGLWVHGPGVIHGDKVIAQPSDLDGVKLRAPTRITNQLFTSLGATTVGMPVPAVPESLSKGVIDATVIPWEVTGTLKVPELVDKHTEFDGSSLYTAAFVMAMNKASYERLPDDLKAVIDNASGLEFSARAGAQMQEDDAPARAAVVERGNTITTVSGDARKAWEDASAAVGTAWVEEMAAKGIDGAALIEEAKALVSEFSAQ